MKLLKFIISKTKPYKELENYNTKLLGISIGLEKDVKEAREHLILALTINQTLIHNRL